MKNLTWLCMVLLCFNHTLTGQSEECPVVFDNLQNEQISSMDPSDLFANSYYSSNSEVYYFSIAEPTVLSKIDLAILQLPGDAAWGYEEEGEYTMPSSFGGLRYASIGVGGPNVAFSYYFDKVPVHNADGFISVHRMDLSASPHYAGNGEYISGEGMLLQPGNYSLYVSISHSNSDYSAQTYFTGNFDLFGCPADNGDRDGDGIPNEDDNCPDLVDTEAPQIISSFDIIGKQKGDKADLAINFSGADNCDNEVNIDAFIKLPDIEGYSVELKNKSKYKVKVDSKKQEVKVEGPDPGPFWEMISGQGGFAVSAGNNFEFKGKKFKEDKDKYEFKFSESDQLDEVKGPVCTLYCEATDQAGNTGHSLSEYMIEENMSENALNKSNEGENYHLVNTGIDNNLDGLSSISSDCEFSTNTPCGSHEKIWISNVTLEDINNNSQCENSGFGDYRNISTELIPGSRYRFWITRGGDYYYHWYYNRSYISVYIDWNRDGDFEDADELVFSRRRGRRQRITGQFTVPLSALGTFTMRVIVDKTYNYYETYYPSPCHSEYGEAEDYTITTCVEPVVNITESELPLYCQEDAKKLTANVDNNSGNLSYSWSTGSTDKSINVQNSGIYSVTVADAGCVGTASYSVNVVPENLLSSYTIIAEEDVHLHGNNFVLNGGIGVLDDKGKVKIHDESFITGGTTFIQADKIEIDNDSEVAHEILTPSTVGLPPAYLNTFDSDNDVKVDKNTTVTLTEQVYGKIEVKEGSTVIFTESDLFINDLKIKEDATLIFPSCAFVRIEKDLNFHKNVIVNPDGHQVQFFVDHNVDIKEGSSINASIDARGHDIKVKGKEDNPTFMNGRFIAKKIHGDKYVTWDWATACNASCLPSEASENIADNSNKNRKIDNTKLFSNLLELKVFPNPASESVQFILPQSSSESKLTLINATGHILWERKLNTEKTMSTRLDVSHYDNGLYFVQLIQGTDYKIQKLIISK